MNDNVNHPKHYMQYKYEVIELTQHCNFVMGNALKYILRSPFKGSEIEDLKKAVWYLNRQAKEPKYNPPIPAVVEGYFSNLNSMTKNIFVYFRTLQPYYLLHVIALLENKINDLEKTNAG